METNGAKCMTSEELEKFKVNWEAQQKFIDERRKELIRNARKIWFNVQED